MEATVCDALRCQTIGWALRQHSVSTFLSPAVVAVLTVFKKFHPLWCSADFCTAWVAKGGFNSIRNTIKEARYSGFYAFPVYLGSFSILEPNCNNFIIILLPITTQIITIFFPVNYEYSFIDLK
ncbi:hypothetical protein [Halalkalibacter hemicellulosilyticus]|uniref:hypothetical protein n=1 Tax=Halalkalibacter hemicellulosilyticus TaxID=127886 RepID=UPI0005549B40|nr:hypothetical protein [Halalkalibacter hemicellulosilyticus]